MQNSVHIAPTDGKPGALIPWVRAAGKLKNKLRWMRGETLCTHLGLEYYD